MDAPHLYPELDDALAEAGDPDTAADTFVIDSPDSANWALRKLAVHAAKLAEAEAFAQRERDRLDLWLAGERHQAEQSSSFLAGLLRRYHEDRLAEQGIDVHAVDRKMWDKARDKTIKLPAGELTVRRSDHWDIDDATFLAWAEQNGHEDVIRRRDPEVDRNAVKKAYGSLVDDGRVVVGEGDERELVPGITVTEGELSFKVRPKVGGQ